MRVAELFGLQGRVAIVTGGGSGLGLQIADALADAGADVFLCARQGKRCREAAEELSARYGVRSVGQSCDIRSTDQIDAIVNRAREELGRVDILINNAGTTWGSSPEEYPEHLWEKVIDVNLTGSFRFAQSVGRTLIEQGDGGRIINVASVAAFRGTEPASMDAVAYNASKGGVVAMTIDLAVKWAQHRITVNALAPGWFPSEMSANVLEHSGDQILSRIPLGRFGGSDDLKGAAVFLASAASEFVTGHTLPVDGGQLAVG